VRLATPQPESHEPAAAGYTVADLCRRWRIGADKVRGFLRRGELVGVNVAATLSGRPQWRITAASVERFERVRSSAPPPEAPRRRRRLAMVDYYPD
jgi:hypothetical protein